MRSNAAKTNKGPQYDLVKQKLRDMEKEGVSSPPVIAAYESALDPNESWYKDF